MPDPLDPALRHAVRVQVVEQWRHRLAQQFVQRGGLERVAARGVGHAVGRGDLPAVSAVVPLVPPAVPDRDVEPAVERGLHARGAAGLQRPQRVVQPHVAALHQGPGERHVVVGQEHDPVPDRGIVGERDHLLDQPLAAVVGGMRLAREDELHGPERVVEQPLEPLDVAQDERGALISREAPREADRERGLVEQGAAIARGDAHHQPKVGHDELLARRLAGR